MEFYAAFDESREKEGNNSRQTHVMITWHAMSGGMFIMAPFQINFSPRCHST